MSDVTTLRDNDLDSTRFPIAAKSNASGARNGDFTPDLDAVIAAWLDLPDAAEAGMMAAVKAATNGIY
ncbi:MAG: hypothetical protein H8E44_23895 [Planctomycetes bacterium]|nr:hypothetical protein [Planctomycetota bacterium]MBL7043425.1 hypothetical protein [Pirellulaceae bacterium]